MAIESTTKGTSAGITTMASFPVIDHNHPLFLQHADTSGRNKLEFVDGRFPKSMFELVLHDRWEKCNNVVLSWIMNVVRPGLLSSVVYASEWLDLRERFDTVNGSRIFHLHREIHTLTQGTMKIADYLSKLRDLWDEYDALMT
ncbi:hypothetical protein KY285_036001 [Solanum tuberosum]|nr:hypothetical protein KY289_036172 [Solanum tuberosum]KAH0639415.1 hypothetical protein KY285_036001 [Solanum tuberosum]